MRRAFMPGMVAWSGSRAHRLSTCVGRDAPPGVVRVEGVVALTLGSPSEVRERLEALFRRVGASAHRLALAITADRQGAEDVVQEAFVRLASREDLLRDPATLDGYFLRAVRNIALDWLRRSRVRTGSPEAAMLVAAPGEAERGADPARIARALASLPPDQREVVVLRVWEGIPFKDIAERTQAPLGTVHSRFRYAMERLRALLAGGSP